MVNLRQFWAGRTVAVTGATGFLGHQLALQLAACGARVHALVRSTSQRLYLQAAGIRCLEADLHDEEALWRGCRGCEFVFHLAGAVDFTGDWQRLQRINVEGTQRLLTAARRAGVRRLVHTSSIVAIGASLQPQMLNERTAWNLGRLRIPYVTTKRRAEEMALAFDGRDLEVVVVNPACVVGPDDFSGSEFGTLCRRFWQGRIPFFFGGGNNFVDVRDVATGQMLAGQRGAPGQRYILGGSNRSYGAFFSDLARAARRVIFRLRLPSVCALGIAAWADRFSRPGRPPLTLDQAQLLPWYFYFDLAKAQRELGYRPRPLAQSLADAHRFWMEQRRGGRLAAFRLQTSEVATWNRIHVSGPASASASPAEPVSSATILSGSSSPSAAG